MGKTCKKIKTAYESAANEVLLTSREKVCDLIPKDDESQVIEPSMCCGELRTAKSH